MNKRDKAIEKKKGPHHEQISSWPQDFHIAHAKEMKKQKAEAYNFGHAQGNNFIGSKTSKGYLTTSKSKGKISHDWFD